MSATDQPGPATGGPGLDHPLDRLPVSDLWPDPQPLFRRLRLEAPVWRVPGEEAVLVSTWDLVAEATSRVEDFSNHFRHMLFRRDDGTLGVLQTGPTGPDVFAGEDPPRHAAHRRVFLPGLVPKSIEALEPFVASLADELLDGLLASAAPDAASGLALPLPLDVVARRIIGFADADLDQLARWMLVGSRLVGGLMTLEEIASSSAEVMAMAPWTAAQLEHALASGVGDGLLSAAAGAVRAGVLTREEASFALMVLVGAGAETTTSLISTAIALLAEHPELQEQLRAEPANVPMFVEEVLRFESPFRYHPRTAARPAVLGGVDVGEGTLVLLLWSSANRDEAVFERPDEVVLGRPSAHLHLGFGRGIHHCVGAPLARLEARVVLSRLLAGTAWFSLDEQRQPRRSGTIWIHRYESLPLVVEPR